MSLHISTLLPSGDLFFASDTRICDERPDGTIYVIGDDAHKTKILDASTFLFMSGNYGVAKYAVNKYEQARSDNIEADRKILTGILRDVRSMAISPDCKKTNDEIVVFYLMRYKKGTVSAELYSNSSCGPPYDNYVPFALPMSAGDVIVLGSYIKGTDNAIRARIKAARTEDEIIAAFREVYHEQCRAQVGGTLELFKASPKKGFETKLSFAI